MKLIQCPDFYTPQERHEWKVERVLRWTDECKFSSISCLSSVLGQKPKHSSDFFGKLLAAGYLVRWKSRHFPKRDLVHLGRPAKAILGPIDESRLRVDRIDKVTLEHDYLVQEEISKLLPKVIEIRVRVDRNGSEAPDAIVYKSGIEKPFYIEIENSKRSMEKAHRVFIRYQEMILASEIEAAFFIFRDEKLLRSLETRFRKEFWPMYEWVKVEGQPKFSRKKIEPRTATSMDHLIKVHPISHEKILFFLSSKNS